MYLGPLVWEFGLALALLFGYPLLTGVGWRANFTATPDIVLVLLTVSLLWLVTGAGRVGKLLQKSRHRLMLETDVPQPRSLTAG